MTLLHKLYRPEKGKAYKCDAFSKFGGKWVEFFDKGPYYYILDKQKRVVCNCSCFKESDLELTDEYVYGDVLVKDRNEYTIASVHGDIYEFIHSTGDHLGAYTRKELDEDGYRLKEPPKSTIKIEGGEYTLEELKKKFQ